MPQPIRRSKYVTVLAIKNKENFLNSFVISLFVTKNHYFENRFDFLEHYSARYFLQLYGRTITINNFHHKLVHNFSFFVLYYY